MSGRAGSFRYAVAAGHRLAAETARDVMVDGGTTADAAIAASAVQCVVEAPWCGLGGDAFAIVREPSGAVHALNGSGAAPRDIGEAMGERPSVPRFGPLSIGVPGLVDAWFVLHERFGRLPIASLLEPARRLACAGVGDLRLRHAFDRLGDGPLAALIGADGKVVQTELAGTFGALAEGGAAAFYRGDIARKIAEHVISQGGALSLRDLAQHRSEWLRPRHVSFSGSRVYTQPPVSMGVLLLAVLRLYELGGHVEAGVETIDRMVAIKKAVFGRVLPLLGDPACAPNPDVLDEGFLRELATSDASASALTPTGTDTTTLAVAGPDGAVISFIHSLFNEFGSRELVPGTGIVLNDRLANLRTDPALVNRLEGGKRPMHTLHGYLAERPDGTVLAGATPGGRGQVQTNLQVLAEVLARGTPPDVAIAQPRWVHGMPRVSPSDDTLYIEPGLAEHAPTLAARGHRVEVLEADGDDHFGSCTVVSAAADALAAFADHRRAAHAISN